MLINNINLVPAPKRSHRKKWVPEKIPLLGEMSHGNNVESQTRQGEHHGSRSRQCQRIANPLPSSATSPNPNRLLHYWNAVCTQPALSTNTFKVAIANERGHHESKFPVSLSGWPRRRCIFLLSPRSLKMWRSLPFLLAWGPYGKNTIIGKRLSRRFLFCNTFSHRWAPKGHPRPCQTSTNLGN